MSWQSLHMQNFLLSLLPANNLCHGTLCKLPVCHCSHITCDTKHTQRSNPESIPIDTEQTPQYT